MTIHKLKTWPVYFQAVLDGNKTFEIRNNSDRGFQKGDTVILEEYKPDSSWYTGRKIEATIGYVTDFDQKPYFVVFSLLNIKGCTECKGTNP